MLLIAGSGASLTSGDDAVSSAVTIPFSFNYFGSPVTQLFAYTNGFIVMEVRPDQLQPFKQFLLQLHQMV